MAIGKLCCSCVNKILKIQTLLCFTKLVFSLYYFGSGCKKPYKYLFNYYTVLLNIHIKNREAQAMALKSILISMRKIWKKQAKISKCILGWSWLFWIILPDLGLSWLILVYLGWPWMIFSTVVKYESNPLSPSHCIFCF